MIFEDKVEMLPSRKNTKNLHRPKNKANFQEYGGGNPPQRKFPVFRGSDNLFLRTNENYPPTPSGLLPSTLGIQQIFGTEWMCLTNL